MEKVFYTVEKEECIEKRNRKRNGEHEAYDASDRNYDFGRFRGTTEYIAEY